MGDLVVILNAGAYGLTASPGRFLSHGYAAEVMQYQSKNYLIRSRESIEDIVKNQSDLSEIFENNFNNKEIQSKEKLVC